MFDNHSAIMLVIRREGKHSVCQQSCRKFLRVSQKKLCTMLIRNVTLPSQEVAAERERANNSNRNYFVFPHRLASGKRRIVEVHSSPVTLQNKQYLFSIIHDITDRKRMENAVISNETNFRNLAESSPNGILIASAEGQHVYANQHAAEMLGYSVQELLQTHLKRSGGSRCLSHPSATIDRPNCRTACTKCL
ncbi:MAG: PAS domain-containing protein [Anaerolineales bacterium]|nr:PAS domain-containing protein [Anaerolineales bacterium]